MILHFKVYLWVLRNLENQAIDILLYLQGSQSFALGPPFRSILVFWHAVLKWTVFWAALGGEAKASSLKLMLIFRLSN